MSNVLEFREAELHQVTCKIRERQLRLYVNLDIAFLRSFDILRIIMSKIVRLDSILFY